MSARFARACLAVMARRPGTGAAKTRLADRLDEAARGRLYEAFLRDKLAQVARIPGCQAVVAVAPPDPPESIGPWLPPGASAIEQRGEDLGARLDHVVGDLVSAGAHAVVLLDSDTPTLPDAFIEEAVRALESGEVDVVVGPAWDGGYFLLGLRAPAPALFQGIRWSTSAVLRQTLAAADAAGMRVHLLPSWFDVDAPTDLDRLCAQLAAMPRWSPAYPTETARALASHVPPSPEPPRDEHWTTRSLRQVYANRWVDVTERIVALPTGHVTLYGVVRTSPCVGVLPFVSPDEVLLVRQFRYVARRFTWEMPTGGVHAGESIEAAAQRELREEAGYEAGRLTPILAFDTSKSVFEERAHLFAAHDLRPRSGEADETEDIERRVFPLSDAMRMARSGEITDAMTLLALFAAPSQRSHP
jgi:rSAM/selenodomain-associated transferase 1